MEKIHIYNVSTSQGKLMKLDYKTRQALSTEVLLETKMEILSNKKGNI